MNRQGIVQLERSNIDQLFNVVTMFETMFFKR